MRHLTLTFALLLAGAPAFAQGTGASIEKSFGSMQEAGERVQTEVTPPDAEKMQEKAEKFIQGLAGAEAASGDSTPAKSDSAASEKKADAPQSAAASNPAAPAGSGMQGMSAARVNGGGNPKPQENGTGALSEMTEKNTLDPTPPGGKVEVPAEGDTVLPRNRKSKRAGIRTGEGKAGTDQAALSGSAAAKPVRKIPGFVELN